MRINTKKYYEGLLKNQKQIVKDIEDYETSEKTYAKLLSKNIKKLKKNQQF